jgi:UPF0716 protein FxsA
MFRLLFVLFIIIPIIEISVLMQVGELLGLWPTIGIVILSAWIGAKYVRQQGLATLHSVQSKMAEGEMPSSEIVTGVMLLIAGVLLVTPGFVTDIFGLSLLVPSVREMIAASVQKHINVNAHVAGNSAGGSFHQGNTYEHEGFSGTSNPESKVISEHSSETIEGEFTRKE